MPQSLYKRLHTSRKAMGIHLRIRGYEPPSHIRNYEPLKGPSSPYKMLQTSKKATCLIREIGYEPLKRLHALMKARGCGPPCIKEIMCLYESRGYGPP